jgi:hypothetical protein
LLVSIATKSLKAAFSLPFAKKKVTWLKFILAGFVLYFLASGQISFENNNNRLASQPLNRLHRTEKTPRGITAVNITSGNDEGG